jgi:putative endonuclease
MKQLFFVYIIQSKKDGSYYTGQCDDLDCRLSKHNDAWGTYSSTKMPWKLVYFETYASRSEALIREKQIKAKKSRKYLQYLIDSKPAFYRKEG